MQNNQPIGCTIHHRSANIVNPHAQDFKVMMEKESKSLASKLDLARLHMLVSRVDIRVFKVPFDHLQNMPFNLDLLCAKWPY